MPKIIKKTLSSLLSLVRNYGLTVLAGLLCSASSIATEGVHPELECWLDEGQGFANKETCDTVPLPVYTLTDIMRIYGVPLEWKVSTTTRFEQLTYFDGRGKRVLFLFSGKQLVGMVSAK